MSSFDDETERYLREFRPRAIRALEVAPKTRTIWLQRLAVAAAVTLFVGGLLWFAHREALRPKEAASLPSSNVSVKKDKQFASSIVLTRLALTDNEKLEWILAEESRKVLPAVQGEQSTLKVLAKE